jgi:hypothetical protein
MQHPGSEDGQPDEPEPGTDTPTGTDPAAPYEQPGYEDKSFGQAVDQDQKLADELLEEEGDSEHAAERFEEEATGAPARHRQMGESGSGDEGGS